MRDTVPGPKEIDLELDDLPEIIDELPPDHDVENLPEAASAGAFASGVSVLGWALSLIGSLIALAVGVWAWDFTTGLLARNVVLGGVAVAVVSVVGLLVLVLIVRELSAIGRLRRIDGIRLQASAARSGNDLSASRAVVQKLKKLTAQRHDTSWSAARFDEAASDIIDGTSLLDLAEQEFLAPLDQQAIKEVQAASARVATVTALIPLAMADVVAALYSNVVMIRKISETYGGRSGSLGSWRLMRAVIAHLAATGVVALGDDLLGSAVGGGVLSKVSRRFGEGLINGALTARVGVAAIEICRPLPFAALSPPSTGSIVRSALAGLIERTKDQ